MFLYKGHVAGTLNGAHVAFYHLDGGLQLANVLLGLLHLFLQLVYLLLQLLLLLIELRSPEAPLIP